MQRLPFLAPTLEWVPHRASPPFSCKLPSHPSPGTSQLPRDPGRILLSKTSLMFGSGGAFMLMELFSPGAQTFQGTCPSSQQKTQAEPGPQHLLANQWACGFSPLHCMTPALRDSRQRPSNSLMYRSAWLLIFGESPRNGSQITRPKRSGAGRKGAPFRGHLRRGKHVIGIWLIASSFPSHTAGYVMRRVKGEADSPSAHRM